MIREAARNFNGGNMTRLRKIMIIGGLALFEASAIAQPSASQQDERQLVANEKAWARAPVDGDYDRMASFMADNYVELLWLPGADNAAGHWSSRGKKQWIDAVRNGKTKYKSVELRNLTVHVQGDLAVVTGEYSQVTLDQGRDKTESGIYANTWLKRNGRWLVVHSVFP